MSVTRNSRLLCPICNELKKVVEIAELIQLECGDPPRPEILPLLAGRVSVENIQSPAGRKLFPANRNGELTTMPEWIDLRDKRWR